MAILTTILPLFAIIALGFAAVRTGYVAADEIRPVADVVMRIALPALVFDAITGVSVTEAIDPAFMAAYAAGGVTMFGLGLLAGRVLLGLTLAQSGIVALGMSAPNSGYLGYPVALSMLGEEAAPMVAQCMMIENILLIPTALALIASGDHSGQGALHSARAALADLARQPIIVGLAAGLTVSTLSVPVPDVLAESVAMLAGMAPPLALFVVGGTLASLPMVGIYGGLAVIVTGKLLLHPAAVLAAASLVPGLDATGRLGLAVFASVPMMSVLPIFGARVGLQMLSATALLVTTAASFVTITALLTILDATLG